MIANGERKFPPLSLFGQHYRRIYSIHLKKKSRFVEEALFQPKNEVVTVPKLKLNEIESAMSMFTLSLTR